MSIGFERHRERVARARQSELRATATTKRKLMISVIMKNRDGCRLLACGDDDDDGGARACNTRQHAHAATRRPNGRRCVNKISERAHDRWPLAAG